MATGTELSVSGKNFGRAVLLLALIGGAGGAPAWAQGTVGAPVQQLAPPKVNQALPGSMKGIMTSIKNGMVRIGRDTYALSPDAILEDDRGQSVTWKELAEYNGFDQVVIYWLGTGPASNQIMQMIVQPPR